MCQAGTNKKTVTSVRMPYRNWRSDLARCKEWCDKDPRCVAYEFDYSFWSNERCYHFFDADTSNWGSRRCGKKHDRCAYRKGCTPKRQRTIGQLWMSFTRRSRFGRKRRASPAHALIGAFEAVQPGPFVEKASRLAADMAGVRLERVINTRLEPGANQSIVYTAEITPGTVDEATSVEATRALRQRILATDVQLVVDNSTFILDVPQSHLDVAFGQGGPGVANISYYTAEEMAAYSNATATESFYNVSVALPTRVAGSINSSGPAASIATEPSATTSYVQTVGSSGGGGGDDDNDGGWIAAVVVLVLIVVALLIVIAVRFMGVGGTTEAAKPTGTANSAFANPVYEEMEDSTVVVADFETKPNSYTDAAKESTYSNAGSSALVGGGDAVATEGSSNDNIAGDAGTNEPEAVATDTSNLVTESAVDVQPDLAPAATESFDGFGDNSPANSGGQDGPVNNGEANESGAALPGGSTADVTTAPAAGHDAVSTDGPETPNTAAQTIPAGLAM